jgi:hypothetical protein
MNKELNLELVGKYPDLFLFDNLRGASYFHMECGDGWYQLLDTLFFEITSTIRNNNKQYWALQEAQDMIDNGHRDQVPIYLQNRIASLNNGNGKWPEEMEFPKVQQIKEKFGTLSVYVTPFEDRVHDLISFAENMSSHICEECGNVGKTGNHGSGWIKTLCQTHSDERRKKIGDGQYVTK